MVDQLIVALGTVEANGTSVRADSKEAMTKLRQPVQSLVLLLKADELSQFYDPMELAGWSSSISEVEIRIFGDGSIQPIHTSLLLAGLKATSERKEADNVRILVAHRKEKTSTISQPIHQKKVMVTDDEINPVDDDDDLIDEDDLLNDTALGAPPSMIPRSSIAAGDDCAGRKPCDDCSCGRAEREASGAPEPVLTKAVLQQKTSACGNCAKGDAFRCASCPFLGKPAFKAGEEHLVLELTDDF